MRKCEKLERKKEENLGKRQMQEILKIFKELNRSPSVSSLVRSKISHMSFPSGKRVGGSRGGSSVGNNCQRTHMKLPIHYCMGLFMFTRERKLGSLPSYIMFVTRLGTENINYYVEPLVRDSHVSHVLRSKNNDIL